MVGEKKSGGIAIADGRAGTRKLKIKAAYIARREWGGGRGGKV